VALLNIFVWIKREIPFILILVIPLNLPQNTKN
jgi:hypothetical protein